MTCPIPGCVSSVQRELNLCTKHLGMVPVPQREALLHYARTRKHGPSHKSSFARAVETVTKLVVGQQVKTHPAPPAHLPYKD